MKFAEKYPNAEPFSEPMQGIYVVPDFYPCFRCQAPTRFIDYLAWKVMPMCSEECAFESLAEQPLTPIGDRSL